MAVGAFLIDVIMERKDGWSEVHIGIFEDKGTWNCGMLITEISKRFRG